MKTKLVLSVFAVTLALAGCAKKEDAAAPEAAAPAAVEAVVEAAPAAEAVVEAAPVAEPAAAAK